MALAEIRLENISVRFGHEMILERVSLEISRSQSCVIVGPSGQGKSVLLKVMSGLLKPTEGQVIVREQNLYELPGAARQELMCKMGMLFQKNALFDSLTCGENIAFPMREVTDFDESHINGVVDKFLEAVGIPHAKNLYPDEISGGMQKRLGIARALALNPEIVFYDDPTAGLDPITSRKIIELILQLKKERGSTVIAITNDMNRAFQMADQIVMVVDHGLINTGNVEQTKQHKDPRVHQFIRGELQGPLTEAT